MTGIYDRRRVLAGTAGTFLAAGALGASAGLARTSGSHSKQETDMAGLSLGSLYTTSVSATSLTGEAADRIAIAELINAWAHCADRRLPEQQAALFTADGVVAVYMGDPATHPPVAVQRGRAELVAALADLRKFSQTTHLNGQSTVVVQGDRAVGESHCFAHQLYEEDGRRKLQVLAIRYHDDFLREADRWLFAARKLIIDWSETRTLDG